jgi:hypothetical protein
MRTADEKSRRHCPPAHPHPTALAAGVLGATLMTLATALLHVPTSVAGTQRTSTAVPAFQQAMQVNYRDLFEAAIITGAQDPNGASMPLERLLAAASRDGLQRLNDQSIAELVRLRSELANRADLATCAGLWSGSMARGFVPAVESLHPQQQREWAQLFDQAARATINRMPIRPAPTPDQYQPALTRMLSQLPPADLEAFKSALDDSAHLTPAQECKAVRVFCGALARTDHADAVTLSRAMLYR